MFNVRRIPGLFYNNRYACVSILIVSATVVYLLLRWGIVCTNLEAWHHVKRACRLYEHGVAIGSFCRPLCSTHDIHSLTCHSFRQGKEAVFSAEWHQTKLVFKTSRNVIQNLHWYDNGVKKYPSEREFRAIIRGIIHAKLNMTLSHENAVRLSRLKPSYEEHDIPKRQQEMDNLWPLVQDNEYLLSALYTDRDVFPQLLGTCGLYFAVEYLEPVQGVSTMLSTSDGQDDWGRRLKLAVMIMELIDELDSSFREPFHLCDIKLNHFGMPKGGTRLKFIDLDTVYPRSVVNKIIKNTDSCSSDEDCDFYDCRARCDMDSRLLMSQHTPSSLAAVLRQCANPESESSKPRGTTPDDIRRRLYNILVEIEQSVNNDFIL
ncbi:uncharacterized protein CBL_11644 [Carabus blaptoides fortunei]